MTNYSSWRFDYGGCSLCVHDVLLLISLCNNWFLVFWGCSFLVLEFFKYPLQDWISRKLLFKFCFVMKYLGFSICSNQNYFGYIILGRHLWSFSVIFWPLYSLLSGRITLIDQHLFFTWHFSHAIFNILNLIISESSDCYGAGGLSFLVQYIWCL